MATQTVLGGVFGGTISGDRSDQTTTNQQVQGGAATGLGTASSAVSLSGGQGATFTVTQESPQAIYALQQGTKDALDNVATTAMGALGFAQQAQAAANKVVSDATASPLQQAGKVVVPIVIIVAIVIGVYLYRRG